MKRFLLIALTLAGVALAQDRRQNATLIQGVPVKGPLGCLNNYALTYVSANNRLECVALGAAALPGKLASFGDCGFGGNYQGFSLTSTTCTSANFALLSSSDDPNRYANVPSGSAHLFRVNGITTHTLDANDTNTGAFIGLAFQGTGTIPAVATCGTIGTGSKNAAGFITSGTTGACVPVLTFTYTATTGWACSIDNGTTTAAIGNVMHQTGSTTTTATFSGTTVNGDVLRFACTAY